MPHLGKQTAKVGKMYVEVDPKGQFYVNVQAFFEDEEKPLYHRVYVTAKSANIAHAKLKKLGFDTKARASSEIDENPDVCEGNEFEANVFENGKYLNYDIVIEREKKSKQQLESLDSLMKRAEPTDEAPPADDIPF